MPNRLNLKTMSFALVAVIGLSATVFAAPAAQVRRGYLLSPKAFRAAVDKVLPSMVTIESIGGVAISPGAKVGKRTKSSGISKPGEGPTTGLIISEDGYIITSTFNFLKNPPIITVTLNDGSQHVAKLLGKDTTRKLCVLKIEVDKPLPVPELVSRDQLKVGQWAISLGVGYGDSEPAMSAGIVSATHRISGRAVQTDANISPANYGGPLIDITGRVIGICSPLSPNRGGPKRPAPGGKRRGPDLAGVQWYDSGIGFAVPLAGAERIIEKLKAGETVESGAIGIQLAAVKNGAGAKITKVVANSPAANAGLKKDDEIVVADGDKVLDVTQLRSIVGRFAAGDDLKLSVKRGDKTLELTVTLALASKITAGSKKTPPKAKPAEPKKEPKKEEKPAAKSTSLFDGKTLGGWKATKFGGEGKVEVKKEQIILGPGEGLTGITWKGDFPKVNYEIELDAMRVKGFDFFCGLTFPYKDSHCSFIVGGWGGTVVGLSNVDEYDASDNQTSNFAEFKSGKWYHIRVRVTEKKIETWIDKKKYVDLETKGRKISVRDDIDAAKPLGVASWETTAALRNIRYRRIKADK